MLSSLSKLLLIRDNEKKYVMYFFTLYAILGCGMALGRNSADVLFFKRFGIEYLPLMYVLLSVFLALVSILYAAFADRLSPERLSIMVFASLICLLVCNWAWISFNNVHAAYPVYFLLYESASEVLIIHSAHYLAQNFDSLQAKRLFPIIMAGTQIGIIVGSLILAISAKFIRIQEILLVWCFLLSINILMIYLWHKQHGGSAYFRPLHKSTDRFKQAVSQVAYGFKLIRTSQMLRSASFALFFMVITFYILCYSVNRIYTLSFKSEAELSTFFGVLTATTNGIALLLQIFITNRVIHRFGVKKVNLFFPITSIFSYLVLLTSYSLAPAILGSINKDAIMPAFRNPVRTIFFNTLPENVQGRARATSIMIVLPLALLTCGLMLIAMQKMGAQKSFLVLGLTSATIYLFFNHIMNKAYVREILSTLRSKVLMPTSQVTNSSNPGNKLNATEQNEELEIFNNSAAAKLFNILMLAYPEKGNELILLGADQDEDNLTDQLIKILRPINPPGLSDVLWELYNEQQDIRLQSSILTALFIQRDVRATSKIPALLKNSNPRLQISAIIGALHQSRQDIRDDAVRLWEKLVRSPETGRQMASLELLEYLYLVTDSHLTILPAYKNTIISLLGSGSARKIKTALNALLYWPESRFPDLSHQLPGIYERSDALTRELCVRCSRLIYQSDQTLLHKAIEDSNPIIRKEAARVHYEMAGDEAKEIFVMWLCTEANGSPRAQNAYLGLLHEESTDDAQFEQIALLKAELAQHFFLGHQILAKDTGKQSTAYQLVKHILQERIKQYIELAVYAIEGFERDEDTRLLSACVNSRDTRHIANACEVLRNFKHRRLGQILFDLVDQKPLKISKLREPKFDETAEKVLIWCRSLPDPWLSMCARAALESSAKSYV